MLRDTAAVSGENVRRLREALERVGRHGENPEALYELLDPEIVWDASPLEMPDHGVYRGYEGVREFWRRWLAAWEDWEFSPEEFVDAGDIVVVAMRQCGSGKGSGMQVEARHGQVWAFRAGKVIRHELHPNVDCALQAVGLSRAEDASSRARLGELVFAFMESQLAYVMARLKLADALVDGPKSVDELVAVTSAAPGMLRRLLRGLVSLGLVAENADGRVSLTEVGALLQSDAAGSMRDVALHFGSEGYRAWGELEHTVRTAEPAFDTALGEPLFLYMRNHPEAGAAFNGTMTQLSRGVIAEAVERYDFAPAGRILDVGGGRGHFVAAVLEKHPTVEGAVFDLPQVAEAANAYLARRGLADRCSVISGNFFKSVPEGYDTHLLKWVLHDWDDESCRTLLAMSHAALPRAGRLLVVEQLLPDELRPTPRLHPALASDLNMLVNGAAAALERSLTEYDQLLSESGFVIEDVIHLPSGFSIISCPRRDS